MENLREKIKETNDFESEIIHIDKWDCDIEVRSMSAKERAGILNKVMDDNGKIKNENFNILMIIASCYDPETNEKIFVEGDEQWLCEKSAGAIEKLSISVMRLSGISKKAVEDAEKN